MRAPSPLRITPRGQSWKRAHRKAVLAGEFLDPCVHDRDLSICDRLGCRELYVTIVSAYMPGGSKS